MKESNPVSKIIWKAGEKVDKPLAKSALKINKAVEKSGKIYDAVTGKVSEAVNAAALGELDNWKKNEFRKLGVKAKKTADYLGFDEEGSKQTYRRLKKAEDEGSASYLRLKKTEADIREARQTALLRKELKKLQKEKTSRQTVDAKEKKVQYSFKNTLNRINGPDIINGLKEVGTMAGVGLLAMTVIEIGAIYRWLKKTLKDAVSDVMR
jgi:hypothetical protein